MLTRTAGMVVLVGVAAMSWSRAQTPAGGGKVQAPPAKPLAWITVDKTRGNLESLRGRIVVVFFFSPGDSAGDKVLDAIRTHVGSMEGEGIAAVGVALSDSEQQVQSKLADRRVVWPVHFDGKKGNAPVAKLWGVPAGAARILLLDPRLRVVNANVPPEKLGELLRQQLELTPPEFVPAETLRLAAEKLTIAEAMLAAGRAGSAARYLAELPEESRTDSSTAERVSAATLALEGKLDSLISESEALFNDDKVAEAALLLEHTVGALKDAAGRDKAEEQLFSFTDDAELKERIEKDRARAVAADLLVAAAEHEELLDRLGAYRLCRRIVSEYEGTPAAEAAREKIAGWEKDPAEARKLRDAIAGPAPARLLTTARSYRKSNLTVKAKQFYEELVREYPGTTAAEEGAKDLAAMGGGGK